jgi:DNA polymerase III subunit delta'
MDFLSANDLPWLGEAQRRLRDARAAGRMPQALLVLSVPGLGAGRLAAWIAALALCESSNAPCGACPSCTLLRSDSHPDFHAVGLLEDAQQVKVDQIRELIEALSLSSYRGGYKVAVVEDAETLNANGANAFLKTLEEPPGRTLLILIAKPSHRLPATIASRCLKLHLRVPEREVALAWLAANGAKSPDGTRAHASGARADSVSGPGGWDAALELAGGAPLMALDLPPENVAALDREMRRTIGDLAEDATDVTALAESWLRSDASLRLVWLENWITRRIRAELGERDSLQSAEPVRLPAALLKPKIRSLFELLDAARELRHLAATGLNQQLALEAFLLGGRAALANG